MKRSGAEKKRRVKMRPGLLLPKERETILSLISAAKWAREFAVSAEIKADAVKAIKAGEAMLGKT